MVGTKLQECKLQECEGLKALTHGAIVLATCNAILLTGGVKLANTCFHPCP